MKVIVYTLLAVISLTPIVACAYTIQDTNISSTNTGGISAGSGEVVVTGSSDASAEVDTVLTGAGGTSTVDIETSSDGETRHEHITKTIPPGGSQFIEVATSTGNHESSVKIYTNATASGSEGWSSRTTGTTSQKGSSQGLFHRGWATSTASTTPSVIHAILQSFGERIVGGISRLLQTLFGI